jgi:hypothetical protein
MNSILDELDENDNKTIITESQDSEEIIVPKICAFCKNNAICSVLPTFINLNKIGIIVSIEKCPFNISTKK